MPDGPLAGGGGRGSHFAKSAEIALATPLDRGDRIFPLAASWPSGQYQGRFPRFLPQSWRFERLGALWRQENGLKPLNSCQYVKLVSLTLPVLVPQGPATAIRQLKALVARSVSQAR